MTARKVKLNEYQKQMVKQLCEVIKKNAQPKPIYEEVKK